MSAYEARTRTAWHPALTTQMCELIGDCLTFAQAGRVMGFTRSALIGRFNRLTLEAEKAGLFTHDVAELLAGDLKRKSMSVDEIAVRRRCSVGAVEVRLAEIRRALGLQAR